MQPCDFAILDAPRAFPNASPWVSLRCTGGSFTVRAFLHSNGFVYLVADDVWKWGGFEIENYKRIPEILGTDHVLRPTRPSRQGVVITFSEAGFVLLLARRTQQVEAAHEVLRWLLSSAVPAVKQAAAKAREARADAALKAHQDAADAAARLAIWGEKK